LSVVAYAAALFLFYRKFLQNSLSHKNDCHTRVINSEAKPKLESAYFAVVYQAEQPFRYNNITCTR